MRHWIELLRLYRLYRYAHRPKQALRNAWKTLNNKD